MSAAACDNDLFFDGHVLLDNNASKVVSNSVSLRVKTFPTALAVFPIDRCTLFPFCCPIIGCLILKAGRSPCDKQLAICFLLH